MFHLIHWTLKSMKLNTLSHSVCALLIYAFWWNKPLDVEQPTVISGDKAEHLLAFFYMTSQVLMVKRNVM